MDPKIVFCVPNEVSALAETVAEYSGTIEFDTPADAYEAATLLGYRAGRLTTVEFALPTDPLDLPLDAVDRVAKVLESDGVHYIYVVGAFTEPSRGVRVPGRVVINEGAGPETLIVPWGYGEPRLDLATLLAAGMTSERASSMINRWMQT